MPTPTHRNPNRRDAPRPAIRSASPSGTRRFEYHRRSEEDAQRQIDRSRSRFDSPFKRGFIPFKARQGDNQVRILPPTWPNPNHYAIQVWMHRFVGAEGGTYLCLRKMKGQRCPICEAERDERERGDPEIAKQLAAREMWLAWILDRESQDPEKPLVWSMSSYQDEDIIKLTRNRRTGATIFPEDPSEGYDLSFSRKQLGKDVKNTRYSGWAFDRDPSPILDDPDAQQGVLEYISEHPLPDILQFHSVEHLEQMMSGTAESGDEELDASAEEEVDLGGGESSSQHDAADEEQADESTDESTDEPADESGEEDNETAEAAGAAEDAEIEDGQAEDAEPPLRRRAAGGNGDNGQRQRQQTPRQRQAGPARPSRTPQRPTPRGRSAPSRGGRYRD